MSDIKNIFDKVREEARQQAERSLYDLESRFPALPIGGDSMFQSARPRYTDEQRQAYIANNQQDAVNRLSRFLVDVALGKNVTQIFNNPTITDVRSKPRSDGGILPKTEYRLG